MPSMGIFSGLLVFRFLQTTKSIPISVILAEALIGKHKTAKFSYPVDCNI